MTRKEARETAFSILFEAGFDSAPDPIAHYEVAIPERGVEDDAFVRLILRLVGEHLTEIDGAIRTYSVNWSFERISRVSLALLRLACCEMFYCEDIPLRVSVNEAVELAKQYDDEKAYGFVNGILNSLLHDARAAEEK